MSEPTQACSLEGGIVPPPQKLKATLWDGRIYRGIVYVSGVVVILPGSSEPVGVLWLWTEGRFAQVLPQEIKSLEADPEFTP